MKPTENQLRLVKLICLCLDIAEPRNLTKESASEFINQNIQQYRCECELQGSENEFLNG